MTNQSVTKGTKCPKCGGTRDDQGIRVPVHVLLISPHGAIAAPIPVPCGHPIHDGPNAHVVTHHPNA